MFPELIAVLNKNIKATKLADNSMETETLKILHGRGLEAS